MTAFFQASLNLNINFVYIHDSNKSSLFQALIHFSQNQNILILSNVTIFQEMFQKLISAKIHCFLPIFRNLCPISIQNYKISTDLANKPLFFLKRAYIKDNISGEFLVAKLVENLKIKFEFLKSGFPGVLLPPSMIC